jgi:hypothetical protein
VVHTLGLPLAAIINWSVQQGIVRLSKVIPVCCIYSDVCPIATTNLVAKVTESFVCKYFNFSEDAACFDCFKLLHITVSTDFS